MAPVARRVHGRKEVYSQSRYVKTGGPEDSGSTENTRQELQKVVLNEDHITRIVYAAYGNAAYKEPQAGKEPYSTSKEPQKGKEASL